ncbi:MAG TPA: CHAT domain-containing tetratricopeptide repeat protein [Polyangiaceae bacterium]|nr:CHAT domain-containing tetratricopeptide repeat protein [Polyangiaceae bacterium]
MVAWARGCRALLLALLAVAATSPGRARAQGPSAAAGEAPALAEAQRLNEEAKRLQGEGAYAKAVPLAERALALREGVLGPNHTDVAKSLNDLAVLYKDQGAYGKAEPLHLRALRIREKALGSEHPLVAESLSNLGVLYKEQGAYAKAEPLYQRALRVRERALGPNHPDVAQSLNNLAELYRVHGAYTQAEPLYQRALSLREKAFGPEHPDVAKSLNNLALLCREQGAYAKAEPLHLRALHLYEKALGPEHPLVASSLNNLALLYKEQGAYAKAEPLYQQALAIREKALGPEHPLVAQSLGNLAVLYQAQGAYAKAEPLHQRSLRLFEKTLGPEHPDVARSLNNLALLYKEQGAYEKAEPLYERAVRLFEKALGPEHPLVASSLDNLAVLYKEQGAYEKAEPLHLRAMRLFEKAFGPEHPDVAESLSNLAVLYQAQGAYEKAEPLYERAVRLFEKALGPEHPLVAESLSNLTVLYQAQGQRRLALAHATRAEALRERRLGTELAVLPEPRKRQLLQTLRGVAQRTTSFHAHDAPADAEALRLALTVALRRKGRVLDEVAGAQAGLRRHLTPALRAELDALTAKQAQLVALRDAARPEQAETVRALEEEVDRREAELSRKSAAFRTQTAPVTVERVQAALPEGAALVEVVRYQRFDSKDALRPWKEAHYGAYLLRRRGPPRWVALGEAEPVERAVRAARRALTERAGDGNGQPAIPAREARAALRALDARVLAPVRQALGEVPHLLVSPDGALHTVPFEALIDERGTYLLERSLVTYLGSGRDLLRMGERLPARSGPLVLAAPDYGPGREPFAPLRGAAAEAEAVRQLFPDARVLPGAAATREALVGARGPRFVLLSTHGFLERPGLPGQPAAASPPPPLHERGTVLRSALPAEGGDPERALERAGLALAGANVRPEGLVSGRDLAGLDLGGTRLVVLSACETGLGQLQDGEGVYGLRRALAIAGAEAQVTSLWSVNDAATGELMRAYFGALRDGVGRSEALRRAQLGLLRQQRYQHPSYWAAFVPAGDWRPLEGGAELPRVRRGGACGCRTVGAEGAAGGAGAVGMALLALAGCARRRARLTEPSCGDGWDEGGANGGVG